jgi:SPP1 family predicted phage head-tail adaptor
MTFTAQDLAHQVTLQRLTTTTNEYGETETVWTTYAEPFARVDPLVGREYFAAAQVNAEASVKFTLRYRDDVKASDRLIYGSDTFDIQSAIDIGGRHRETLIYAKGATP